MAADLDIVGGAGVDVVPVAPNFHTKLKAIVLPIADKVGEEAGKRLGEAMSKHIVISIPEAIQKGGKAGVAAAGRQGDDAGGAFARSLRRKLQAAFKAMPKLDVKLGDTGVDAELARIRAKLEALSNKRIGIDISATDAEAQIVSLEAQLRELGAQHPNVAVRADTATARAALAEIRAEIAAVGGRQEVTLEVDGSFGAQLRAIVAEAQASIPDINVDADTSPARAEVQELRARLAALADVRVGIDIDAASALAEITAIQTRLEILAIKHVDIDVRVDAARAAAQLAALQSQADGVKLFRIKALADTSQATSALMGLGIQMAILTAIPLGPVIAAGLGAIVSAATVAAAGVASVGIAAVPAILGVTKVIQAKSAADKESASASDNSAAASKRAAQNALQMASAQQALSSAHRNAARSVSQANRQIEDAERSVAQAAQRAADQRRQAIEAVQRAERSLTDAKRDARQAEESLTQARADAEQQLRDLNDQLANGALDQRDAAIRVREAEEDLNRTRAQYDVGKATDLQMERAQLAFDQATEHAKQQKTDYADLQKDAEAQRKAGVDGNEDVKRAADQLADAQRSVADQTKAVADAHRAAARTEVEAAQSVADAQRGLADARASAADAQVQAAESIESAERGVQSARLSALDATAKTVSKSDEYRKALAKLTPEQRALYDSIAGPQGITAAFKAWSKELQPDVLPLFTRTVDNAKRSLPGLTPLVKNSADAIGGLMDRASRQLKNPFWTRFKKGVTEEAEPAITGMGVAFGNVLKGIAGIIDAFLPHMDGISETMQRITGRFADWATNLRGSPEFERFLQYVKDTSPGLAEFLGDLMKAALDVAQALAPLSETMFAVMKPLLDGISWIAENAPEVIQLLWGLYAVHKAIQLGMAAFALAMGIYEIAVAGATLVTSGWAVAIQATGIVPLIEAIVIAVALLVIGIIWAYKNVGWFRDAVDGTWKFIKVATLFLWNSILKPAFDGIWWGLKKVGEGAVWLWDKAIKPAFDGIMWAGKLLVAIVLTVIVAPLVIAFNILSGVVMLLWKYAVKPAFEGIAWLATWLWEHALQPALQFVWDGLKWLGDAFVWLYDHAVKPALNWIADKASWLWRKALQPALKWIWDGLKWLGSGFKWLYDKGIKPPIDWIADKADWLYRKGIKPAFDRVKSALRLVADGFEIAKKAIGRSWDQVSDIAKKPVNFIIKWVYTKGIKAVWDKVAGFVGLKKLPDAPKLLEAGGTVGNGWGPASPMKVNRPTAIVGEGNPRYPEFVIPTDPKYRSRAVALHNAAGMQLLAKGGVLGDIGDAWDWTKDSVSDVVGKGIDWAKTGADLISDPSKVWDKLMKPVLSKVSDGVGVAGQWGATVGKFPLKMATGLKDKIVNAVSEMFDGGGGGIWQKPVNAGFGTRFGVPGLMWSSGRHTGLDFPAAVGTAVKAVAGGRVSQATSGGPYGKHIMIDHGGGLQSLYAHLSRMRTSVPTIVGGGDRIGDVGATGNVTGPHLHLEARLRGKAVDPMKYLSGSGFTASAVGEAQQYAKSILSNYGWGPSQFGPLQKLWNGESGWRWNAKNPSSGAYGIPQALPASKMASAGADWLTNFRTQVKWGLNYIKHRPDYGSPSAAYSKWMSRSPHWYDSGGMLQPGLNLVANGTGKPEPVLTSGQWDDIRANKAGGPTQLHADVRVFVGTREITDIVDTRIELYDAETAMALDNGRRI